MSRDCAKWDDCKLSLMLDLVAKQKELCHWGDKGPTSIGWTNIYRSFNDSTKLGYSKKQIQNKFNELKRLYFNWRDGCKHTGIIISCFAMENYLWLRQYGDGSTYDPSEWVAMNTATNTSELRELVSAAVWPA